MSNEKTLKKYMVQTSFKFLNKDYKDYFSTKLEIKKHIEKLANKNKHTEIVFFLYSVDRFNKNSLIGYLEYNYGKWENCDFYKRGTEENIDGDFFSWEIEPEISNDENLYKTVCNKYIKTRGEHYIVEDIDGIHYLELDDEYENINKENYKQFLENGVDTTYKTYKELYESVVEYNVYEDLKDKNYGYTLENFYLSNKELIKLGIAEDLNLELENYEKEEEEL